jgi:hypothetical protein
MLNTVVDIQVAEVKCVFVAISTQHVRRIFGHEEAEGWCKIVRPPDCCGHVFEANPPT